MKSALFAVIAASVTLAAVPAAQQRETRERHVYIGVTDKNGTPVPTLAPADVVIKEDGDPISKFESKQLIQNPEVAAVMYTMLLVDVSGMAWRFLVDDLDQALARFEGDRGKLVEKLGRLSDADWQRTADHPEYARYSIFLMFRHLALHDLLHAYRIEEILIKRDWEKPADV